ncbi:TIGR03085 family protein [Frankia sp. CNm7]|uniref:TIGR03085 family protein n=1 Tax=Frankia nepalensis TaxID=1836974 RepID=A0A937RFP4_9ACTN|nr:TIGR03085 family metal-binding protein [Frankia nepalensis]MBL7499632.1 TIGR03085 family protein [Frankia nepalensis]MBL7515976.1 TIGR03085 family protein [Frankia nepalensis]MBL7518076.1 TIGR03085 family protein [Frankia nepalensis]MBL7628009.1 TIGR03085 family protein [Frankia nepalensis]
MGRARDERALLADVIEAAGPGHPTLCEGWDTYDLVAHLVTRERVLKAGPGLVIPKLHGVTERAERATREKHTFPELVEIFRSGPPRWQPSRLGAFDDATNLIEFFIHAEDVRRAPAQPPGEAAAGPGGTSTPGGAVGALGPRELSPELREKLWAAARRFARVAYRRVPFGVLLERTDGPGQTVARKGDPAVTLIGTAADLLLYGYGRRAGAQVKIIGDPDLVAALATARLGL